MNDNIDLLKTEVDEIKKSLNELKDNISFSETEKKDQAEILNKQAEVTKQKIQKEIDFLANKTDEESKRKKEEAEALLISCNDITALYNSIINPSTSSTTQSPSQSPTESTNIFTKAKDWIKNQRNSILDRGKWRTE
jgi:chromosome segregation ATPase